MKMPCTEGCYLKIIIGNSPLVSQCDAVDDHAPRGGEGKRCMGNYAVNGK